MNEPDEHGFALDPRLAADTAFIADWGLSHLLLMDDARFPWLVLVPRRPRLVELHEMQSSDQLRLLQEINQAMGLLRAITPCDKLNVGALGNVVRQLHVHVVARRENDAAWPGPVWGSGAAVRYGPTARTQWIERLRATRSPSSGPSVPICG